MKQTIMAYMVATIVSFAVISGLTMQPLSSMAQREDQVQQGDQIQNPDNIIQRQDQADGSSTSSNIRTSSDSGRSSDSRTPTTTATCGQMIEGLVELNSNLMCSGDGLIVGADRTTIRLNGHTIMGPGPDSSKVGISIGNHDGVTIEGPGTVEQWQAAVLASGAAGTTVTSTVLRD